MRNAIYRSLLVLALICGAGATALADDAPAWLQRAATIQTPTYDKKVNAVVLVNDSTVTVGEDGQVTEVKTYAVRIFNRDGRREATAMASFGSDSEKVKDFHAWMIKPSGQTKSYGKDQTIEQTNPNDIYNEWHAKIIAAADDVEPGSVFGFQSATERRPYFYQTIWFFQEDIPVISSHFSVVVPNGWKASGTVFNHVDIQPTVNGNSYSWELQGLPPLEDEAASPTWVNLAPRVAVKYFPTEGAKNPGVRPFEQWADVSRWYSELSDPQAKPDEKIAAKARELTANAKTELDKIRAIGTYVQNIQYISIQIGVGRFRPHAATDVLTKAYGDCKDKANLMRALLAAVNIQSYPVLIFSGDSTYVRDAWVSPSQFNHCIIAIKVSDETKASTVVTHPTLGRLLIFDSTDDDTPVGDLPEDEQGSFALIAAGDSGSLMKMPETPSDANSINREIDATLTEDGTVNASIRQQAIGQRAVDLRRLFHGLSRPDSFRVIEGWVTSGATTAKVSKVDPSDKTAEGKFDLDIDFSAVAYAQLMQNRLLVFKPTFVSRRDFLLLTEPTRRYPIVLDSHTFSETVHVKLPAGFAVDELPDPLKLEAPFGSYKTTYEVKGEELIYTRTLAQRASTIPADQYQSVRSFFERIRASEQSPVVLTRK